MRRARVAGHGELALDIGQAERARVHQLNVEAVSRTSTRRIAIRTPITRAGATVAFDLLQPDTRVRLSFDACKPLPILVGIAILP